MTERNQLEETFKQEHRPIQVNEALAPQRSADKRQSRETDGGVNPYSDFEEDDDKAAVGSGVVETNENYDDDEDDDYAEIDQVLDHDFNEASDSAGETSLKADIQGKAGKKAPGPTSAK